MRPTSIEIVATAARVAARKLPRLAAALAVAAGYAAGTAKAVTIPLCPGLTIVTAISESDGDYESIKTVEAVDADRVRIRYSSEHLAYDLFSPDPPGLKKTLTFRTVRREDMETAFLYLQYFDDVLPELVPETTAISISRDVFEKLKTEGAAEFGIFIGFGVDKPGIDREEHPNVYDNKMVATVTRVDEPAAVKVAVNGRLVELPAMKFEGDFYGDRAEFYVLDDPEHPLMLKFRIGIDAIAPLIPDEVEQRKIIGLPTSVGPDREVLQVVKIADPCIAEAADAAPAADEATAGGEAEMPALPAVGAGGAAEAVASAAAPDGATGEAAAATAAGSGDAAAATEAPPAADIEPEAVAAPAEPEPSSTPPASPQTAALEREIAAEGSADVETIFFTVNSAELRPESDAALTAIAEVLRRHPDWRMRIEGHTDSQADEAYNLDLSKRRAAAVQAALVGRYGIAPERLESTGHGESRPVADNATLEGRALNRRVELVRLP